ncbi:unnamed protein product [Rotaria sordida]|uniref:Uncharacterized protein n=1 Tax=Rotaria sordida TaxID=392033 RepID=A0A815TK09_9BILA|nr:unnamed protein product [Rotaria sordida]CAF1396248.1 unnamed protein product [Rotaria sordida]CAF1507094.1 unnamed protein product [Rotaria sordida]
MARTLIVVLIVFALIFTLCMINVSGDSCGLPSATCSTQGVTGCIEKCRTCGYPTGYCKRKWLFWSKSKL